MAAEHKFTEDEVWEFCTKSITRVLYDIIATHEVFDEQFIPVDWLRDYADDLAIQFPRIKKEDISR